MTQPLIAQTSVAIRRYICDGRIFCLPSDGSAQSKAYRAGYLAGWECDMSAGRPETSDAAWDEHVKIA